MRGHWAPSPLRPGLRVNGEEETGAGAVWDGPTSSSRAVRGLGRGGQVKSRQVTSGRVRSRQVTPRHATPHHVKSRALAWRVRVQRQSRRAESARLDAIGLLTDC